MNPELTDSQQHVLSAIIDNPGRTVRQVHDQDDIPIGTISNCLTVLREKGLVKPNPAYGVPGYGLLYPTDSTEPQCPAPVVDASTAVSLPKSASTTDGTESADIPGTVASVDPASPSTSGATPALLAQTESAIASLSDVTIEDYGTLGDAARELAAENARLRSDLASVRELLGENLIEPTLCHLSDVLVDAGAFIPKCNRAPDCRSLHLLSRIHELANSRDTLRVENARLNDDLAMSRDLARAAVADLGTLANAAGLTLNDPAYDIETMARLLKLYPILQEERNAALDKVAGLRHSVRDLQLSCSRYQDDLSEIAALCLFLGFDGSGDTMDMVLWLLTTLGGGEAVHAFRRRQFLQREAMELEAQSLNWRTVARDWMGKAQALAAVGPCPRVGE